ncbi:DUF3304 domain-containing protein [Candidatus Dactylopiibacterium carminicum]|uniref:DUF3304 domain-containing protein n=1 Tax=Candidatus Dactylopiibacterium carminicum TaxID=857335 RepID=UPI00155773FE|nr:DUF4123 domain-containing protein [Candidatus Dactylopiibacterium carminicum]
MPARRTRIGLGFRSEMTMIRFPDAILRHLDTHSADTSLYLLADTSAIPASELSRIAGTAPALDILTRATPIWRECAAPILLQLPRFSGCTANTWQAFAARWQYANALVLIEGALSHATLCHALHARTEAMLPDAIAVLLRYFDTRVLPVLLTTLETSRRAAFLSIASTWLYADRYGIAVTLQGPAEQNHRPRAGNRTHLWHRPASRPDRLLHAHAQPRRCLSREHRLAARIERGTRRTATLHASFAHGAGGGHHMSPYIMTPHILNSAITMRRLLCVLLMGTSLNATAAGPKHEKVEPFRAYNLTLYGYNYTDMSIGSFEVNGAGGGNIEVGDAEAGGGKFTCCASLYTPLPPNNNVHIKWSRDGKTWCETKVPFSGPIPAKPEYMEVHFYRDGHIEVAVTESSSPPRLKLERASPGWRYAEREQNINNDHKFARCQRGYF